MGNQDKEIIRSVDRAINTEESRIKIFGEGYTRQSLTLGKQYVPALLGHIVAAKPLQYEREVWRALKDIARDDLAWRLFCAGVTAVCNEKAGCDKDGYKNIREQALVIGAGLVGCLDDRELQHAIGLWGMRFLCLLPIFDYVDGVLVLTEDVVAIWDEALVSMAHSRPSFLPIDDKCQPWTQVDKGGFPKDYWTRVSLTDRRSIKNIWRNSVARGRMDDVLSAVNYVQDTSFTINAPVYKFVMEHCRPPEPDSARLKTLKKLTKKHRRVLRQEYKNIKKRLDTEFQEKLEPFKDVRSLDREKKRECARLQKQLKQQRKKEYAAAREKFSQEFQEYAELYKQKLTLDAWKSDMMMAETKLGSGGFQMPTTLDFRGRLYYEPYLNFQRADHVRGQLLFANGTPIGDPRCLIWLYAHVGS